MNTLHGIRASPNDGVRSAMSGLLTKDNYASWSIKMKTSLLYNEVWDLVTGTRERPDPPPRAIVVAGAAYANLTEITNANKEIEAFKKSYLKVSWLIASAISEIEILAVGDIIADPVATWAALSHKYARKSKMAAEAAHMALLLFEHVDTELADETISRFQAVVLRCNQQLVKIDNELLERMFLSPVNDRYTFIRDNYMHSAVQQDLDQIFTSVRDIDLVYQSKEKTPPAGTAAFMEAVRLEVEKQTAAAAELYWVQRGKEGSRSAGPARPASSSTTCYCCTERGHYQRDGNHFKSQC